MKGTRFFWGHGTRDPNIPFEYGVQGRAALREAGAELETWDGPIGHWIDPQEVDRMVRWVEGAGDGNGNGNANVNGNGNSNSNSNSNSS